MYSIIYLIIDQPLLKIFSIREVPTYIIEIDRIIAHQDTNISTTLRKNIFVKFYLYIF